jgi:hypothetical protein
MRENGRQPMMAHCFYSYTSLCRCFPECYFRQEIFNILLPISKAPMGKSSLQIQYLDQKPRCRKKLGFYMTRQALKHIKSPGVTHHEKFEKNVC